MSAEIISLSEFRAARNGDTMFSEMAIESGRFTESGETSSRFHFWTGASGRRYVHTVYAIDECPPLDQGNFILIRTGKSGREILAIGRLFGYQPSENLNEIRQLGARLGADQVHVHLLATSNYDAQAVEIDLKSAQFASQLT